MLPVDHGYALFLALAELMPWIADEELLGIHPIQGANLGDGNLMVGRRCKLMIRARLRLAVMRSQLVRVSYALCHGIRLYMRIA
jgi:Cas6 Crispr